jgi:hypothetical protein
MNFEGVGNIVAEISNPKWKKNKIVYLAKDEDKNQLKNCFNKLILDDPESKFEQSIDKEKERIIGYFAGSSGSGKSYCMSKLMEKYHKLHPKNPVYIFSSVNEDKAFDKFKFVNRIKLENLLTEELDINDFADSLLIMDDIDNISNKKIKEKVLNISNSGLQTGRHSKTSMFFSNHILCDGKNTKHILNEAHSITIFPKTANSRNLDYLLGSYIGLNKPETEHVKKLETRPCCILKSYPQILISDNEISFTKDLLTPTNSDSI